MVIYLKHPIHGNKVAIDESEAKADEANGWERYGLLEENKPRRRRTLSLATDETVQEEKAA